MVEISPTGHIFMDKKQQRKWCMPIVDVKGDGLAMKGLEILSIIIAVVDHKNVLLGLVTINKQQKGKRRVRFDYSQQVENE